ncbi:D-2-hydroxyacid dehydrogenase [Halorubrum sp. CSM-61]|uniref:D-2-hydroxyacid dehydrogenase n=1 Tax=Halorubrum sp. CSM-61 TaxID=2485838 RepID=UPI000F4C6F81|nr:D-2-hydroxyacid dehydrogenase [Halorubrum sp. CSM-61]
MEPTDVLVLDQPIHGMSPAEYRRLLEDRLPNRRIELAATPSEIAAHSEQATVMTGYEIAAETVAEANELELFACTYAGTDHLPLAAFKENGVKVTNASGVHAPNAAEQVLAVVLSFTRHLDEGWHMSRKGSWSHYWASELQGSTVTVVGMGAIGTAILDRLSPFGVERIGIRHTPSKGGPAASVRGFDDFDETLPETDYLVLACPLTETTRGLVDETALELLPPDAVLVNIARGPVVDTDALVASLKTNGLRGAALDVTAPEPLPDGHPLWNLDNVLITPHNAGHTPKYWERRADILVENVERLVDGRELENLAY